MDTAGTSQSDTLFLKEHDPLTELLSQIPHKVQRGLKTQHEPLELTCIDVNQNFIALGSNIGTVFLYDRDKHTIQRLRSEDTSVYARCVALHHGLDDLVAIGYSSGSIYIFQLPSMLMGHSKQLERFVVGDLHQVALTTLTWSTNGMKLFSGDTQGCVGCTEVDFIEGKCKSSPLLIEANTEVVQLDPGHRSLLVSTKHRTIVCRMDDKDKIKQIGSKERKITGDFGACFIPAMCKPDDAQLFATRPGFRIWKASIHGTVNNTFIFKELLSQTPLQIPLLDFTVTNIETGQRTNQFGPVLLYKEDQIVTWNESSLFVLDIVKTGVVGVQSHIGRIKDVVVSGEEIFVLRVDTDRNVIRIAYKPLQSSRFSLLKYLQEEREEKELKVKEQEKRAEEAKEETSTESSKTHEKSPFKFLQDNIMDKVKIIAKPTALKEKIQEKLKLDNKKDNASKYTQEYVFEDGSKDPKRDVSPPGPLPPVIRLDSPDLLTVEISDSSNELTMTKVPSSERFSTLSGDASLLDREICTNENQSVISKTGTGAASALARLQEDHKMEEDSEPVFRVPEKSAAQPTPTYVVAGEEEDSIVFSRKPKHKKKKKGREKKTNSLAVEKDQDTVSVNSIASVDSYHSDRSSPVLQSKSNEEVNSTDTGTLPNDTDSQQEITTLSTTETVDTETVDEKTNTGNSEPATEDILGHKDLPESILDSKDIVDGKALDITVEDSSSNKEGIVGQCDICDDHVSSPESPDSAIEEKGTEKHTETLHEGESKLEMSNTSQMSGSAYDIYAADTDPAASNLDKEMARLDSYLSETSDPHRTETRKPSFEKSTSEVGSYKSSLSVDIEQANYHSLESTDKSKKLEDQLEQLEAAAMLSAQDSDKSLQGEHQSMSSLPSLSSLDRTSSISGEDFYSKYATKSPGELSPSIDDTFSDDNMYETHRKSSDIEDDSKVLDMADSSHFLKTINNWTEIAAFGNIHSLSVSRTHVWITDKSSNIYFSGLSGPGLNWKKATGSASQVSVSLCGNIVWILHKNTVSAGTKITQKRPEGMKWVEAVRDVANICVDKTCAWYIKTNFDVMIQTGLSKDRPCYKADLVDCPHKLKQIVCRDGVVWALTESCKWLYRSGVKQGCLKGQDWKSGDSGSENRLFSHLALGDDNFGWAIDVVGQVWFRTGVTMETPRGEGKWWQVPLSGEYFMKDPSTLDMLKSFSTKFDYQKLTHLLTAQSGGLVSGTCGIWVCPEFKHMLHVCRGNIEGHLWEDAQPENLSSAAVWKTIACRNASTPNGLIWGQQPSGDLFTFSVDRKSCYNVQAPSKKSGSQLFVCMSVCTDALWGLTCDGEIYIRTGMSLLEQKGNDWCDLNLSQIEHSHLVHISCSKLNVWAVDSDGLVFHRIGVKAPTDHSLNAAWLPVDNGGTVFTQVVTGAQDWKVWAIDNRRQVYVRTGITTEMPIGREWMHVSGLKTGDHLKQVEREEECSFKSILLYFSTCFKLQSGEIQGMPSVDYVQNFLGTQAMQLTMSDSYVWALNHSGELLCRHGVSIDNVTGDYWKKLPGFLTSISAAPNNALWGTNKEGQLIRRRTRYIIRELHTSDTGRTTGDRRGLSIGSDDGDWELV